MPAKLLNKDLNQLTLEGSNISCIANLASLLDDIQSLTYHHAKIELSDLKSAW